MHDGCIAAHPDLRRHVQRFEYLHVGSTATCCVGQAWDSFDRTLHVRGTVTAQEIQQQPVVCITRRCAALAYPQQVPYDHRVGHHDESLGAKHEFVHATAVDEPGGRCTATSAVFEPNYASASALLLLMLPQCVTATSEEEATHGNELTNQPWVIVHVIRDSSNTCSDLLAFQFSSARASAPFIQRLEQRLISSKIGQLALRNRNVLASNIRLEVALADCCQQPAQAVLDVALPFEVCID